MRLHLARLILVCALPVALMGCTAETTAHPQEAAAPSSATSRTTGSSPASVGSATTIPDLNAATLEAIARTRVFFAHRSVGADIVVKGLSGVYLKHGVKPPVVNDGAPLATGSFGDRWLNQTENPQSKLDDFDMWIREKGVGSATDIAFMKLGFVDITAETDVNLLFKKYKTMMDGLERDYPRVRFLYVTVSVTRWDPENNAAIQEFNQLMRKQYGSSGRLFDLAATLSTCPDGKRDEHKTGQGKVYFQICQEYTTDGGHLNELGAEDAATEMLKVIAASLPSTSATPSASR